LGYSRVIKEGIGTTLDNGLCIMTDGDAALARLHEVRIGEGNSTDNATELLRLTVSTLIAAT
jgi:hypothetical protein